MQPRPGQIGCAYTGKTGGPTRTETPTAICAWDGAGIASIAPTSSSNPSDIIIRIILTSSAAFSVFAYPLRAQFRPQLLLSLSTHYWPKSRGVGWLRLVGAAYLITAFLVAKNLDSGGRAASRNDAVGDKQRHAGDTFRAHLRSFLR